MFFRLRGRLSKTSPWVKGAILFREIAIHEAAALFYQPTRRVPGPVAAQAAGLRRSALYLSLLPLADRGGSGVGFLRTFTPGGI